VNAFTALLAALVAHGPMLLLGSTIVLAGGCLGMWLHRDVAQRRRLGIATACGCGVYLLLAIVPLPRLFVPAVEDAAEPAAVATASEVAYALDPEARAEAIQKALAEQFGPASPPNQDLPTPPGTAHAAMPAPVATATTATAPTLPWSSLLAITYLVGASFVLLRATLGLVRLRLLLRQSHAAPGTLLRAAALPAHVRIRIARTGVRPFCTGWLFPVVVLGPDLLAPKRSAQALAVVRHEAAHLRARDPLVQLLLTVLAVPLFCHPLFWWLCRQVRFCSELLADDAAAATSRTAYARELIDLAGRDQPTLAAAGTVAVFHRPSDFYRRIQMLLQREGPLSLSTSRARRATHALATLALVATAAGLFGVPAAAQDPQGRTLRKENQALRAEIEEMRNQIAALRDEIARTPSNDRPTLSPLAGLPPGGPGVQPPALPAPGSPEAPGSVSEQATADALTLIGQMKGHFDQAGGFTPAPGTDAKLFGRLETEPAPGVPMLSDIPLLGRMFVPDANGLPSQAMNVTPPERSSPVATTEATADLASRYLDLQADLELAEVTAAETKELSAAGFASNTEARKAAVHLRTLQKKLAIVKKLVAGEIEATQSELQWLERKKKEADKTDRLRLDMQVHRARMRLEALSSVQ